MKPIKVTLKRNDRQLEITWSDGRVCHYALDLLREACPCVECRGGHENMGKPIDADSLLLSIPLVKSKSYEIVRLEPVGNYALKPVWADGHDAGLYTWVYLRELVDGLEEAGKRAQSSQYRPLQD
jgi:DUF971 family protein